MRDYKNIKDFFAPSLHSVDVSSRDEASLQDKLILRYQHDAIYLDDWYNKKYHRELYPKDKKHAKRIIQRFKKSKKSRKLFVELERQTRLTIDALFVWSEKNTIPNAGLWVPLSNNLFNTQYVSYTTAISMYSSGKDYLETLLDNIETYPVPAQTVMRNLTPQLDVCAPGVYGNLQNAVWGFSQGKHTVYKHIRLVLLYQYAVEFTALLKLSPWPGMEIHYDVAFKNYVSAIYNIPFTPDEHISTVKPEDCKRFLNYVMAQRSTESFFEILVNRLEEQIQLVTSYEEVKNFVAALDVYGPHDSFLFDTLFCFPVENDYNIVSAVPRLKLRHQLTHTLLMRMIASQDVSSDCFSVLLFNADIHLHIFTDAPALSWVETTESLPFLIYLQNQTEKIQCDILHFLGDYITSRFLTGCLSVLHPKTFLMLIRSPMLDFALLSAMLREASPLRNILVDRKLFEEFYNKGWRNFSGMNTAQLNLNGLTIVDADFSRTDLKGANLTFTVFQNVNIEGAKLDRESLKLFYRHGIRNFKRVDLSDTDLSGLNLESANFAYANFSGTKLTSINLKRAKLFGIQFSNPQVRQLIQAGDVNFSNFNFSGFDLSNLHCHNVKFINANLTHVNFSKCQFGDVYFENSNLTGASFKQASLGFPGVTEIPAQFSYFKNAMLFDVDFSSVELSTRLGLCLYNFKSAKLNRSTIESVYKRGGRHFEGAVFCGQDFVGLCLKNTYLTNIKFENPTANLNGANLSNVYITKTLFHSLRRQKQTNFRGVDMKSVKLQGENLSDVDFSDADLRGSNLLFANLTHTCFLNAKIDTHTNLDHTLYKKFPREYLKYSEGCPLKTCKNLLEKDYLKSTGAFGRFFSIAWRTNIEEVKSVLKKFDTFTSIQAIYDDIMEKKAIKQGGRLDQILKACATLNNEKLHPKLSTESHPLEFN